MSNSSNPFIAIEEFYLSNDFSPTSTNPADPALYLLSSNVVSKLKSLGPSRIRDMRANNVAMQVLSHIPVDASPKTCQKLNDTLYSSMIMNQDRFAALAMLPCWDAKEAASELQRCVTKYKFVGGVLGFRRGVWEEKAYDGQAFEELWKAAERYKVPIALRPLFPTRQQLISPEAYPNDLHASLAGPLVVHFHSSHTASPYFLLRLYISGLFDRHPNLRLIISQNGHSIPALLPRIEALITSIPSSHRPKRRFIEVWQQNIYVSTADVLDVASMRALLEQIPVDRVLFAGNYPWEEKGKSLMGELKESRVLEEQDWERVACKNAETLFGLRGGGDKGKRVTGPKRSASFG